jgi:hypothetical protein
MLADFCKDYANINGANRNPKGGHMTDPFKSYTPGMTDPIHTAIEVVPNDSADIAFTSRAVYVGTAGNLRVTLSSGEVVTFAAAGTGWHPIRIIRVWATGTTAADLVACA